jgi:hypothetical protein
VTLTAISSRSGKPPLLKHELAAWNVEAAGQAKAQLCERHAVPIIKMW